MKVNIYYGGRGVLDDPTLYVLNKMEEVLKRLIMLKLLQKLIVVQATQNLVFVMLTGLLPMIRV